jgi:membrane protease YdiL (CAAX protease family)
MAVTVFVFSFVMGISFRYSGSLWTPIVTHSASDLPSFVIFDG